MAARGRLEAVITNHLSYLDNVVLGAVQPFIMVAKSEGAAAAARLVDPESAGEATVADDMCWWADAAFVPHLFRLLGLGRIRATVWFGDVVRGADRFELASEGHRQQLELYRTCAKANSARLVCGG